MFDKVNFTPLSQNQLILDMLRGGKFFCPDDVGDL